MARLMYRALVGIATCAMVMLLAGCATTHVDAQWQNPEFARAALKGPVLVVGMTKSDAARRLYEDAMAARLSERGVTAIPSYKVLSRPLDESSSQRILDVARTNDATTVLSSVLIRRETVERLVAGPPGWQWDPWFTGWYHSYWPYTQSAVAYERYVANTSLADVATGKTIWSARSSTDDVGSLDHRIRGFASAIVHALDERGLV